VLSQNQGRESIRIMVINSSRTVYGGEEKRISPQLSRVSKKMDPLSMIPEEPSIVEKQGR
jgi:hypothetical protein